MYLIMVTMEIISRREVVTMEYEGIMSGLSTITKWRCPVQILKCKYCIQIGHLYHNLIFYIARDRVATGYFGSLVKLTQISMCLYLDFFRRSRIRSLLAYFCNYKRFCLTILKITNIF